MEAGLELSIVVPVRLAEETILQTLRALLDQCRPLPAEVIAVVSSADPTAEVLRTLPSSPQLRVIEVAGPHSVPQLRAEGIRAARGRLVAITEDHCLFSACWAAGLIEVHKNQAAEAIGGPVENGRCGSALDWAIYFSRYLSSMPPLGRGPAAALPGNNACYKREVLDAHRSLFADGFWEFDFHNELLARGGKLWLEPGLAVTHNKPYRFGAYLALRCRHARCFGGMLGLRLGAASRLRRIVLSPLVPVVLAFRSLRTVQEKKRRQREFLLSFPALLLCYLVWFWGELVGLLFGPGDACSQTD
ncbi:MAG: glycosyltransferase [Acidobacteria bacterium]|nr:glycosyltransferase [Acidobacteriota bacterium]